jgi:hypothetical protein
MAAPPSRMSPFILPTAATMIGIGLAVVSLLQVSGAADRTLLDEVVATTSVGFLVSVLTSYIALRRDPDTGRFHDLAEWSFILSTIVLTAATVAYELEAL